MAVKSVPIGPLGGFSFVSFVKSQIVLVRDKDKLRPLWWRNVKTLQKQIWH